eukprot:5944799-Heterocapsa_arctica.AAC.1
MDANERWKTRQPRAVRRPQFNLATRPAFEQKWFEPKGYGTADWIAKYMYFLYEKFSCLSDPQVFSS